MSKILTWKSKILSKSDLIPFEEDNYVYPDGSFCIKKVDEVDGDTVDFDNFMMDGINHIKMRYIMNPGEFYYDKDGNLHVHLGHNSVTKVPDPDNEGEFIDKLAIEDKEIKLLKSGDIDLPTGVVSIHRLAFNKEFEVVDSSGNKVMWITNSDCCDAMKLEFNLDAGSKLTKYGFATIISE